MTTKNHPHLADDSRDDNTRLWYPDPTGSAVVRRLMPGDYAITDASGFTIMVDLESIKPALAMYTFTASRSGKTLRARLKKKAADAWQGMDRESSENPTAK